MSIGRDVKDKSVPLLVVNELIVGINAQISGLETELDLVVKSIQHVRGIVCGLIINLGK